MAPGVPQNDEDILYEPDRMTALGTLLNLHGGDGEYPFTAWGDSPEINWPDFVAVRIGKSLEDLLAKPVAPGEQEQIGTSNYDYDRN